MNSALQHKRFPQFNVYLWLCTEGSKVLRHFLLYYALTILTVCYKSQLAATLTQHMRLNSFLDEFETTRHLLELACHDH